MTEKEASRTTVLKRSETNILLYYPELRKIFILRNSVYRQKEEPFPAPNCSRLFRRYKRHRLSAYLLSIFEYLYFTSRISRNKRTPRHFIRRLVMLSAQSRQVRTPSFLRECYSPSSSLSVAPLYHACQG